MGQNMCKHVCIYCGQLSVGFLQILFDVGQSSDSERSDCAHTKLRSRRPYLDCVTVGSQKFA